MLQQAWVYGHIQLSSEEAAEYKDIPAVYNGDYVSFAAMSRMVPLVHIFKGLFL